jgi:antitoxin (DNA-binding transcriptional repressor) of toxin-antitoxin stability system
MDKAVTATEAVRDFSGLLNTIKFQGATYIIKRGGKPIASMGPVKEANAPKTLKELKGILNELPRMGDELGPFEEDLIEVLKAQPSLPDKGPKYGPTC